MKDAPVKWRDSLDNCLPLTAADTRALPLTYHIASGREESDLMA